MAFPLAISIARQMLADPHFAAREAIIELPHPKHDNFKMQNVAPKLSGTPGKVEWVGPELGQHNEEIYCGELGYSAEKLQQLKAAKII